MRNSLIPTALFATIISVVSLETQAVALNNGDVLTITTGQGLYDTLGNTISVSGSYYGVDTNGDNNISQNEKILLAQGTTGLVIGALSTPGAYHFGMPTPTDMNAVTAPDAINAITGSWYFDIAPTGSTQTGLDMRGWDWAWGSTYSTQGNVAWQPGNCATLGCSGYTFVNGVGRFQWDGVYGHTYTLDNTSTVPPANPSGIGGFQFYTHLEGTVTAVPEPSPVWLFGSALLVLFGIAKHRKV